MPREPRLHVPGTVHHVMARGNGGQAIVSSPDELEALLDVIAGVKKTSDFSLYAFCLMTNHLHLLLDIANDPLSHIMHRIQTTWAKRFNIARGTLGHVFQNRFKSKHCDNDEYLKWLLRYIHLNPIKAGLVAAPEDWRWSSYRQYIGLEGGIADLRWPLSLFGSEREPAIPCFRDFVMQGLTDDTEPLGLLDSRAPREEIERNSTLAPSPPTLEEIAREIAGGAMVGIERLLSASRARTLCSARRQLVRQALASGHRAADLARFLGVSPPAITQMARVPNREGKTKQS